MKAAVMSYLRSWVEVDLGAVASNIDVIRRRIGRRCRLLAVVKANAYGLGALAVARTALSAGADVLGVGDSSEALELRHSGITAPIMILGAVCEHEIEAVVQHGIIPTLHSEERARRLQEAAARASKRLPVNLMVDTGMGRLGVKPETAPSLAAFIASCPNLFLLSISTHFPCAHVPGDPMMREQLGVFGKVLEELERRGLRPPLVHAANSAALFAEPSAHFDMVRPGAALHGIDPGNLASLGIKLRHVVSWFTQVVYLKTIEAGASVGYGRCFVADRKIRVATLPVGYADGFWFSLAKRGWVLVCGRRCRVLAVTMDYVMVDVSGCPEARVGSRVVVMGRDGEDEITINEMAHLVGVPPYNILTALGRRVARIYTDTRRHRDLQPLIERPRRSRMSV